MELAQTIVPKSDQLNADDFMAEPMTVTVADVKIPGGEQPVHVITKEFGPKRPFKPSKSMRRVLIAIWGHTSKDWIGQRMTLFRDPHVRFGGDEVGGIRISHMSGITEPQTVALTVTRGKRAPFVVHPLDGPQKAAEPPADPEAVDEYLALITETFDLGALRELWKQIDEDGLGKVRALIVATNARKKELAGPVGSGEEARASGRESRTAGRQLGTEHQPSSPAQQDAEAEFDRQSAAEHQAYLDAQEANR